MQRVKNVQKTHRDHFGKAEGRYKEGTALTWRAAGAAVPLPSN